MCVHVKQTKTGVMLKHRRLSDSCWCYFSSRHQNERSATKTLGDVQTMFRRRSDDVTVFLKNRFLVVTTTKRQKKTKQIYNKKKVSRQQDGCRLVSLLVPTFLPPQIDLAQTVLQHQINVTWTDTETWICSSIWLIWDCRRTFGVIL